MVEKKENMVGFIYGNKRKKMHVVLFDDAGLSTSTLSRLFTHQCSFTSCWFNVNLGQNNNFSYKGNFLNSMATKNYNCKK